jgi:hypothetical protein
MANLLNLTGEGLLKHYEKLQTARVTLYLLQNIEMLD